MARAAYRTTAKAEGLGTPDAPAELSAKGRVEIALAETAARGDLLVGRITGWRRTETLENGRLTVSVEVRS